MRRIVFVVILLLAALVLAAFAVTGTTLIPTTVALGPCLKDYTSAVSYKPRVSGLASVRFNVGDAHAELCYGRPVARGRAIYGQLVPFGELWRLGANEPTRLYVDRDIVLAGIPLAAGRYSLYVRPEPDRWTVFVTRSVLHWGNDISRAVRAQEVGQAVIPIDSLAGPVDTFTAHVQGDTPDGTVHLLFDWERTRLDLEIERHGLPTNLGALP